MIQKNVEDAVRGVVEEFVRSNETFSAFDVTENVRTKGIQTRHGGLDGIRNFVHGLFQQQDPIFPTDYTVSVIDFGKGPTRVFHPVAANPNDYNPNKLQPQKNNPNPAADPSTQAGTGTDSAQAADPAAAAASSPSAASAAGAGGTPPSPFASSGGSVWYGPDKYGRLCVRSKFIAQIGLRPGDSVAVYSNSNSIHIKAAVPVSIVSDSRERRYKVTKKGNVVIRTQQYIHQSQCKMEVQGNEVVLSV